MRTTITLLCTLALLTAACGGDEEPATPEPATGGTAPTGATGATGTTAATGTTGADCADLTGEGDVFTVVMVDNAFEPACFTASAEQGITLVNEGSAIHNFTMVGTQVDVDVPPGEEFNGDPVAGVVAPGTYELICDLHEALGMVGEVTVV
jgi:plastocyanin